MFPSLQPPARANARVGQGTGLTMAFNPVHSAWALYSYKVCANPLELNLKFRIEAIVIFCCCNPISSVVLGEILCVA